MDAARTRQTGKVIYLHAAMFLRGRTTTAESSAQTQGWTCAKCGQDHQHGALCTGCGAALLRFACRRCGAEFAPGTAIPEQCGACGAPFELIPGKRRPQTP